ncbi:MAG: hypothetical protein H7832_06255 [Magnetococcus sp. DMHC-6]
MSLLWQESIRQTLTRLQVIWAEPEIAPFEIELKRLEKHTRPFCRHDPVRAYYILGLIATLKGSTQEMQDCFRIALLHSGQDEGVLDGYASCLGRLGLYSESKIQYEILYKNNATDMDYLAQLILTSLASASIQEAMRWIDHWSVLNPNKSFAQTDPIAKKTLFLQQNGISDNDIKKLRQRAFDVLAKENKFIKNIEYLVQDDHSEYMNHTSHTLEETEDMVRHFNQPLTKELSGQPALPQVAELVVLGSQLDGKRGS